MKRWRNLFDKIVDIDNILLAHSKARKGKTDRPEVQMVDRNPRFFCEKIRLMLIDRTYKTSEYDTFIIHEPKERVIFRLPYYPDRIIHHAIMNIMEPLWVNQMIPQTYSCIKKRGIHKALQDIRRDLKDVEGTKYCLKMDIRKFYPSIDHDVLKQIIRIKLADNRLLTLLDEIIDSAEGVPIGNYLSLFFANLYLAYFDKWVKEQCGIKYYYRYADDIVILHGSKEHLHTVYNNINKYINNIKLYIKLNHLIFPVDSRGINFVGYVIYHTHTKVRKHIKKNFLRKNKKYIKHKVSYVYYRRKIGSYLGWFKHANCFRLMNKHFMYKELLDYLK